MKGETGWGDAAHGRDRLRLRKPRDARTTLLGAFGESPALPTAWVWASGLQDSESVNHPVCGTSLQ